MFGDTSYVEDADANERWEGWRHALLSLASKHEWRVAMVEVGCGGNVATVRHNSESLLEELIARGVDATLVRINPEMPQVVDYVNQKAEQYDYEAQKKNWERKLEISETAVKRIRSEMRKMTQLTG